MGLSLEAVGGGVKEGPRQALAPAECGSSVETVVSSGAHPPPDKCANRHVRPPLPPLLLLLLMLLLLQLLGDDGDECLFLR